MPAFPHGLSRRAVLGSAAALALGTTGCSVHVTKDSESARSTPRPTKPGGVTPDVAVATTALLAVGRMQATLQAAVAAYPGTRQQWAALTAMHRAHARSLTDAVPERQRADTTTSGGIRGSRDRAFSQVVAAEKRLHGTLGALSLEAESGEFARLLASMSTAISLRLAGLQQ